MMQNVWEMREAYIYRYYYYYGIFDYNHLYATEGIILYYAKNLKSLQFYLNKEQFAVFSVAILL